MLVKQAIGSLKFIDVCLFVLEAICLYLFQFVRLNLSSQSMFKPEFSHEIEGTEHTKGGSHVAIECGAGG